MILESGISLILCYVSVSSIPLFWVVAQEKCKKKSLKVHFF